MRQTRARAADSTTCGAARAPIRLDGSAYAVVAESAEAAAASTIASWSSAAAHVPLSLGGASELPNVGRVWAAGGAVLGRAGGEVGAGSVLAAGGGFTVGIAVGAGVGAGDVADSSTQAGQESRQAPYGWHSVHRLPHGRVGSA